LPPPKPNSRSTYHKILDREAWTHAVAGAAIVLEMDGETSKNARIVLGGVEPIPCRLERVETMLASPADHAGTALAKPQSKVRTLWPKTPRRCL
jgi:CO/xanthine dehydrogenase FAD-binding subunit